MSLDEMIERERVIITERLPYFGTYREGKRQASAREMEIHRVFFLLSLHHFGVPPTTEQSGLLDVGCELARDFFAGDWWKSHKRDIAHMLREKGNDELEWFEPLRLSLLLAALNSDRQLLQILADWPSGWMRAEWRAAPFPEGIEQLYFAILTQLGLRRKKR